MNTYAAANYIRKCDFKWEDMEYLNGKPIRKNPYMCCKCGTNLMWNYQEHETYLIKCPACETITIVQANNPYKAMSKVGKEV